MGTTLGNMDIATTGSDHGAVTPPEMSMSELVQLAKNGQIREIVVSTNSLMVQRADSGRPVRVAGQSWDRSQPGRGRPAV